MNRLDQHDANAAVVRVKILGELARAARQSELSLTMKSGDDVCMALRQVLLSVPELRGQGLNDDGSCDRRIVGFLNGRNLQTLYPEERAVRSGDRIVLTRPISGG